MTASDRVSIEQHRLVWHDGKAVRRDEMHTGAVHYWRLSVKKWESAIVACKRLGLRGIDTYVPWNVHFNGRSVSHESVHFNGRSVSHESVHFNGRDLYRWHDGLGLHHFLELIKASGMFATLRVGPHAGAELPFLGVPESVIYNPACQALSPTRKPVVCPFPPIMFPAPSYASQVFRSEVDLWYAELAQQLAPYIYPNGPVVMVQIDNEGGYYFRASAFDQDYHPDAIDLYRSFLKDRHVSLQKLSRLYHRTFQRWADVQPPVDNQLHSTQDVLWHLDWARFQEHLIHQSLTWFRDSFHNHLTREMGRPPLCLYSHNLPLGDHFLPMNIDQLETSFDVVGSDYYHKRSEFAQVRQRSQWLGASSAAAFAPEMGVGGPPWFKPLHPEDGLFSLQTATAYGLKGFNLYMAVGRELWSQGLIDSEGHPHPHARLYCDFMVRLRDLDFHALERHIDAWIILPKDYIYLSRCTHALGPLGPQVRYLFDNEATAACWPRELGFDRCIQRNWWSWVLSLSKWFDQNHIAYAWMDEASAVRARRKPPQHIAVPTFDFASPSLWQACQDFSEQGHHVWIGPEVPKFDTHIQPFEFDSRRFSIMPTPEAIQIEPAHPPSARATYSAQQNVWWCDADGQPRVLFAINPTDKTLHANIEPSKTSQTVQMEPYSVGIFEMVP